LPSVDGSSDDVYWVLTDIGWRIGGFWFCDDGLTVFWITVLGSGETFVYVSFDDADRGSCVILSMLKIAAMVLLASLVSVWFFPTLEVRSCFKKGVALFHFCLQMDEGVNRLGIKTFPVRKFPVLVTLCDTLGIAKPGITPNPTI
jgi:hypothetical protein